MKKSSNSDLTSKGEVKIPKVKDKTGSDKYATAGKSFGKTTTLKGFKR